MQREVELTEEAVIYFNGEHQKDPLPEKIQALLTPHGFNEYVQHIYQNSNKLEIECYNIAEDYFHHVFGKKRYEDYNSYKSSYHQVRTKMMKAFRERETPLFPEY